MTQAALRVISPGGHARGNASAALHIAGMIEAGQIDPVSRKGNVLRRRDGPEHQLATALVNKL
jgi:hypothetical protein